MKIYFVRHGETEYNKEGKFQGQTDIQLNERGKSQAEALSQRLGDEFRKSGQEVSSIYCSPLKRTRETADAIGDVFDKKPKIEDGLKEMNMGDWEGKTKEEVAKSYLDEDGVPIIRKWQADPVNTAIPGGEKVEDVDRRVMSTIEKIIHSHNPGDNIIIVTHGGPISVVLCHVLKKSLKEVTKKKIESSSLTVVELDQNIATMKLINENDIAHLKAIPIV